MQAYIYSIQTTATIKPYIVLSGSTVTPLSSIENSTCIHGLNVYFDLSKTAMPVYQFCQYTPNLTIIAPSNVLKLQLISNHIVLKHPYRYELQYSSYNGKFLDISNHFSLSSQIYLRFTKYCSYLQ